MAEHEIVEWLSNAVNGTFATESIAQTLKDEGFEEWSEGDRWSQRKGSRLMLRRGAGGIIAASPGSEAPAEAGFRIAAAHSDSPALKLKTHGARQRKGGIYVPVEVYGGPILSTWLDRELLIAGQVVVRTGHGALRRRLVRSEGPCALIPSLAIHLNREVNKGFEYNAQDHLPARLALPNSESNPGEGLCAGLGTVGARSDAHAVRLLNNYIATRAQCEPQEIVSSDLFLTDATPPVVLADGDTIVSGRIDNLVGCYTSLHAFLEASSSAHRETLVLVIFDNEEVGSRTAGGADSSFLERALSRLAGSEADAYDRAASKSVIVSNDGAHALHDSYASKYDGDYAPVLGGGPVIKTNAGYRYASSAETTAITVEAARACGVTLQYLAGRSDMRTGSTIGPFAWSRTGIGTVDIGVPMLAMHSARESASLRDIDALRQLISGMLSGKWEVS